MLDFQPFSERSYDEVMPLFLASDIRSCDYSFGTAYQWRAFYGLTYCVRDDMAFLRGRYVYPSVASYLMPVGRGDLPSALKRIEEDARETGRPFLLYIAGSERLAAVRALYGDRITQTEPIRDNAEYLYDVEKLKTFSGKSLHGQKNHLNRFLRENPDAEFVPVTAETLPEAEAFLEEYERETAFASQMERDEVKSSAELLRLCPGLGLPAGFIRTGRGIAALSAGEVMGNTLIIHVEKARTSFSGAYQAIVALFARYAAGEGVTLCNREDDSGDPGLRESKLSYRPSGFIEKYSVLIDGGKTL